MDDKRTIYRFEVTGGFDIQDKLEEEHSAIGTVKGFKLPDGRVVRPCVALEVEEDGGTSYSYITSEQEMAELGLEGLDYDNIEFMPTNQKIS